MNYAVAIDPAAGRPFPMLLIRQWAMPYIGLHYVIVNTPQAGQYGV